MRFGQTILVEFCSNSLYKYVKVIISDHCSKWSEDSVFFIESRHDFLVKTVKQHQDCWQGVYVCVCVCLLSTVARCWLKRCWNATLHYHARSFVCHLASVALCLECFEWVSCVVLGCGWLACMVSRALFARLSLMICSVISGSRSTWTKLFLRCCSTCRMLGMAVVVDSHCV